MYLNDEQLGLRKLDSGFPVDHLDVERLLEEWRWLCPQKLRVISRSAFGDLVLCSEDRRVHLLDVSVGEMNQIAESEEQFRERLQSDEARQQWFHEADERKAALRGLVPNANQCIAFSIPIVFKESGAAAKPYIIDVYECVSFLGDLNHQIRDLPDGDQIRLNSGPKPPSSD